MITIDLSRPEPIEEQICLGIQTTVARGIVKRGDELPSVRQLAGDLGIHWNTVARAYRRLRDEGLLSVGRGRAVRVSNTTVRESHEPERNVKVDDVLDGAFTRAKLLGLSFSEFRDAVNKRLENWQDAWEETAR